MCLCSFHDLFMVILSLFQDRQPDLFSSSVTSFLNRLYKNPAVITDTTSANGVANVTPLRPMSILKISMAGMSKTPFLMIESTSEDFLRQKKKKTVLAIKDSAQSGAAKAMTCRNLVPNSTESGSSIKNVTSCLANTLKRIVQHTLKPSETITVNRITSLMRSCFRAP